MNHALLLFWGGGASMAVLTNAAVLSSRLIVRHCENCHHLRLFGEFYGGLFQIIESLVARTAHLKMASAKRGRKKQTRYL